MVYLPKNSKLDENLVLNKQSVTQDGKDWETNKDTTKKVSKNKSSNHKKGKSTDSSKDALMDEPERFLKKGTVTYDLLNKIKPKIVDYKSFVSNTRDIYSKDNSLRELVDRVDDGAFIKLFKLPEIQEWLKQNTSPLLIEYLKKRLYIGDKRANNVLGMLTDSSRRRLYTLAKDNQSIRIPSPKVSRVREAKRITSPVAFTKQQVNYLALNRNINPEKLRQAFNDEFGEKRSVKYIQNGIKNLPKN